MFTVQIMMCLNACQPDTIIEPEIQEEGEYEGTLML
jgi:hypothetical protein